MKLTDIRPKEVNFELCGVALTYRPFTIADDLKAQDLCGGQKAMSESFSKFDFEKISLVAWYQLTLASQKRIIQAVEGVYKDSVTGGIYIDPETGEEVKALLKPIEKFRNLFVGIGDQIELIINLTKCKGINIPDLGDDKDLKKWVDQLEHKLPLTGQ